MEAFRESALLLITTPIYIFLIGLELLVSHWHGLRLYSGRGTLANIYLSSLNFTLDILMRGACLWILGLFFTAGTGALSLEPWLYWLWLFLAQDLAFYLLHYVDHHCRLFWAVHVTHHSSEEFNLTVGFRSSVLQPLYRFLYFIPIALAGFRPEDILLMYAITQIYGIMVHTRYFGKLGPLEWILVTPSHHRVHHACNPRYLDRNLGMVLIIWDRLFGTFTEETEEPVYGLTKNIHTHHPLKLVFHEWISLLNDIRLNIPWSLRLKYIFGPPGWSHDGSRKTSKELRAVHGNIIPCD